MRTAVVSATALVAYLWLCLTWFDHDVFSWLAGAPPAIPALVLLTALGTLVVLPAKRPRPGLSEDGRIALAIASVSLATRLPFLWGAYGLFSSDASAQGLMALHIVDGRHHPIFLYNWSYVGSIKAHLTAALTWVSGEPVVSFALAAALMYAGFTAATYLLARTVASRAESLVAAGYVIVAPGFLTAWGIGNEGNYVDVMLLGSLMLVLAARVINDEGGALTLAFWMGVLGGLAFWVHILATYYLLTAVGVLLVHRFGRAALVRLASFAGGFVVGDFPGILWNASNEWLSFRWWSLDAETVETTDRIGTTLAQLKQVGTTSFAVLAGYWPSDAPPPPSALWHPALSLLIPGVFVLFAWKHRAKLASVSPELMMLGFSVLVVLVFAISSFGWMTAEPRYLLFLFSVVPVFLGTSVVTLWRWKRALAFVFVGALVFVNVRGNGRYLAVALESDGVNREFVEQIEALGVRYVRSDYHLSYKYVFLSHGRMVWTSELGPAQTEWYYPFRDEVARAERVALVPRSFRFARRIRNRLDAKGIRYRQADLLYPVLFDFSEPISLSDLR
jgi:hypothetical protein